MTRKIYCVENKKLHKKIFGLEFKNPVGLAAGFDKNAKLYNELTCFGFGFIEVGTVTPKAQSGNPKKRLYRLIDDEGIINRMGFNNEGMSKITTRLKKNKNVLIGGNIGKNKSTPNNQAVNDYLLCFNYLHDFVDYFVMNVSSPNTPNLRELQNKEPLVEILKSIKAENLTKSKPKPILLKISPDLSKNNLSDIVDIVLSLKIDGIIATNTTIQRNSLKSKNMNESGGLSGKPISERSNEVIRYISEKSKGSIPIIGVGGIHSAQDAIDKINAGADLVQIYTGFIYEGPSLVRSINKALVQMS
jgi:dihydroorotate dehydrogenase